VSGALYLKARKPYLFHQWFLTFKHTAVVPNDRYLEPRVTRLGSRVTVNAIVTYILRSTKNEKQESGAAMHKATGRNKRYFQLKALILIGAFIVSYCAYGQKPDVENTESGTGTAESESSSANNPSYPEQPASLRSRGDEAPAKHCQGAHVNIEDLNLADVDVGAPPFSDSITGADNPLRRVLLCHDFTYRVVTIENGSVNTLAGPIAASQQTYVGQRPTWDVGISYTLNADLRSIHLSGYQLTLEAFEALTNWAPAFPQAMKMTQMVLYKPFIHKRLELKAGYQDNESEFIGMQVGGNISAGQQGVYAIIPYEVGLAYKPLTAPTFTVRVQPTGDFYGKAGLQRSTSPVSGLTDIARDAAGFRFAPRGDGLLSIFEGGYNRASRAGAHEFWVRGGYLTNTTSYANAKTSTSTRGNHCWFLLADRQLRSDDAAHPERGLYLGASAISGPPEVNAYSRYYELRLYKNAPFRNRPSDLASIVSSYTDYSRFFNSSLISAGKTAATSASTLSSSYALHVRSGTYLSTVLSYDSRPAITPRLPGALTITAELMLFF
jgi:porin